MAQFVMKLNDKKNNKDYYLQWSTNSDSPTTYGGTLDEIKDFYKEEYGREGLERLLELIPTLEETGCALRYTSSTLKDYIRTNRAGDNGKKLTYEGILDKFCRNRVTEL